MSRFGADDMSDSTANDPRTIDSINCIISDVDGVMTDGRIIYHSDGTETKQFHVRDGMGVKLWLRCGFEFCILTSRNSPVVQRRAEELGIEHVRQGFAEKLPAAEAMLQSLRVGFDQLCYIGDDLPDVPVMRRARLAVAPADAATDVRAAANWTLDRGGGEGCIRELVERLLRGKERWEEAARV